MNSIFAHLWKEPIGSITNKDLLRAISEVKHAPSQREALECAFQIIVERYQGYRFHTLLFWKAVERDPNVLWTRTGFMHCTQQNFLLRVLLIESGWFADKAIDIHWTLYWYVSPHQYLTIRLLDRMIAADPWNYRFGTTLGRHAFGFSHRLLDTTA